MLHIWHPSYYPCHKHGSKSRMSKERIVITTTGTYQWSFVTQIFRNGSPTHGDHRKTSEVMTSTKPIETFDSLASLLAVTLYQ